MIAKIYYTPIVDDIDIMDIIRTKELYDDIGEFLDQEGYSFQYTTVKALEIITYDNGSITSRPVTIRISITCEVE